MSSRGTTTTDAGAGAAGDGPLDAQTAFELLPRVLDALVAAPWWTCGDSELVQRIGDLAVAESRVVAAQVAAVGEGIARGLPEQAGAKTGGQWLRGLLPTPPTSPPNAPSSRSSWPPAPPAPSPPRPTPTPPTARTGLGPVTGSR